MSDPTKKPSPLDNPNRDMFSSVFKVLTAIKDALLDTRKVSIEGAEIITIRGIQGPKPTDEELVKLITPLIPPPEKAVPGPQGKPLKWEDLTPAQRESLKGKQGEAAKVDYAKINSHIEEAVSEIETKLQQAISEIEPEKGVTADEVIDEIKTHKKLSYNDLKDRPDLAEIFRKYAERVEEVYVNRPQGTGTGGGVNVLSMLFDVAIGGIVTGQSIILNPEGKFVPYTPGGVGGASISTETATIKVQAGDDVTIDLSQFAHTVGTVQWVSIQGQIIDADRWGVVGSTLTINDVFDTDSIQVQYTYA